MGYEIDKSSYKIDETREILQITTQDQVKAREFVDLIKKGKNFNELARVKFNLNDTDTNIGFLKKSELPSESANKIFNAQLNETLGPIKTKFGLSIYKIISISPEKKPSYEVI